MFLSNSETVRPEFCYSACSVCCFAWAVKERLEVGTLIWYRVFCCFSFFIIVSKDFEMHIVRCCKI